MKEAIYIKAMNPSLNRDGGRYSLTQVPVRNNISERSMKSERIREEGGGDQPLHSQESNTKSQ